MAAEPQVAVIVGDYSRRRYLRHALDSLAAQTLPRDRFEVIVTKNYVDPELDGDLDREGIVTLLDDEPRIGVWLGRAIARSTAPILTFLDDDDEFEPERLDRLVEVFGRLPDLGFYRNRLRVIDEQGRPVPPQIWGSGAQDPALDASGPVHLEAGRSRQLFELGTRGTNAAFNSSTMAIRRELLSGEVGEAFARTQLPDHFFFLAAALSPLGTFLDDRRLTRYRRYPGNVSDTVGWLASAESSYGDMAAIAARRGRTDLAAWLDGLSVHYGRMFRGSDLVRRIAGGADRSEISRRTAEYFRYLGNHPRERAWTLDTWAAGAYGIAYVGFPRLARRLVRSRLRARHVVF